MNHYFFFRASESACERLELSIDDFKLSLLSWNCLCKEINKSSLDTDQELYDKIAYVHAPSNCRFTRIKGYFKGKSWEDYLVDQTFSLIINACTIFEGWAEEVLSFIDEDCPFMPRSRLVKALQFPEQGKRQDVWSKAVAFIKEFFPCPGLGSAFINGFRCDAKYSLPQMNALLKLYRLAKEMRNCYIHSRGVAGKKCATAYKAYQSLVAGDLGVKKMPSFGHIVEGRKINPDCHGAIGVTDVIIRMIRTIDAELIPTQLALEEFKARYVSSNKQEITLKSGEKESTAHIEKTIRKIWDRKDVCQDYQMLRQILKDQRLCKFA